MHGAVLHTSTTEQNVPPTTIGKTALWMPLSGSSTGFGLPRKASSPRVLTEKAILLKKRNNLQAMESSQSMAELNAKLLMLEQLKSKGYLAPDVFETQSREINGQINEIKTKRIQSLSSALDVALEEFKTLQARLNEIDEPLDSFDPKLFEEVIKGMTVNNRDDMTFRLIGDLTFTVRL